VNLSRGQMGRGSVPNRIVREAFGRIGRLWVTGLIKAVQEVIEETMRAVEIRQAGPVAYLVVKVAEACDGTAGLVHQAGKPGGGIVGVTYHDTIGQDHRCPPRERVVREGRRPLGTGKAGEAVQGIVGEGSGSQPGEAGTDPGQSVDGIMSGWATGFPGVVAFTYLSLSLPFSTLKLRDLGDLQIRLVKGGDSHRGYFPGFATFRA